MSSTRLKAFCSSPIVFTPMDPDITPDSPDGCIGRGPALALGTPAVRWRKPRRLRQEGAVGVVIMITDTRGPWHADMVRSVAARPRGAKCAKGLPSLVLTRRRLELTDAGRNVALGSHELWCRRLQAGTLSGLVDCFLGTAALLSLVHVASWTHAHSSRSCNLARWSYRQLKMELQSVCQFALLITRWRHQCEVDILPVPLLGPSLSGKASICHVVGMGQRVCRQRLLVHTAPTKGTLKRCRERESCSNGGPK